MSGVGFPLLCQVQERQGHGGRAHVLFRVFFLSILDHPSTPKALKKVFTQNRIPDIELEIEIRECRVAGKFRIYVIRHNSDAA